MAYDNNYNLICDFCHDTLPIYGIINQDAEVFCDSICESKFDKEYQLTNEREWEKATTLREMGN